MLRNYLKIALRNLSKHKLNSFIHILGLSLGMGCCLLIFLFVRKENSFDKYHSNADRIYRVIKDATSATGLNQSGNTPYPLAEAIRLDFPEIEGAARFHAQTEAVIAISPELKFKEDIYFAEPQLFEIFDFKPITGEPSQILREPGKAILAESYAKRFFGTDNPIGKKIKIDSNLDFIVEGIIKDLPKNTHLQGGIFVSYTSFTEDYLGFDPNSWGVTIAGSTYVLLPKGYQPEQLERQLEYIVQRNYNENEASKLTFRLQPLKDIHFSSDYTADGTATPVSTTYLSIFSLIGVLILLVACINFINLSTAQAVKRAKEIGVRKVIGAKRSQLIKQFLGEAFLITFLAAIGAVIFVELSLPKLNELLEFNLVIEWFKEPVLILYVVLGLIVVSILAGLYPAFVVSGFSPTIAIKQKVSGKRSGTFLLRKGLVTAQFAISILLVIGTLIVSGQLKYFLNKELGFNKEALVVLSVPDAEIDPVTKEEWLKNANVQNVSFALGAPTSPNNIHTSLYPNPLDESNEYDINLKPVDAAYQNTFGLELVTGRWFTEEEHRKSLRSVPRAEREYYLVVNETLAKTLGYASAQEILNEEFGLGINGIRARVIGVVKDYNLTSLHEAIDPLVMMPLPQLYYNVGLKINTDDISSTMGHIEKVWSASYPDYLFEYNFLDESLAQLYESETQLLLLFKIFAGIAILIACLGLWGLAIFTIDRRTKEIGVRKILGASIGQLTNLLSSEFARLVILASVIAMPIAYWGASKWLQSFTYHIDLNIWTFLLAGAIVLILAWLTVGYHAIKAAFSNPVEALRYE